MSKTTEKAASMENLQLSKEASPYILLQRISTQRWNPSNWFPEHIRPFDGVYKNVLLKLEALLRHDRICDQYLDQIHTEFKEIKPHLPDSLDTIMDIGCGMAGIDLFLWNYYKADHPELILFDKSKISEELYYKFYNQAAFYNSLQTARENLTKNGVPNNRIQTVEATQDNLREFSEIDFCISLYSWGFHYPVGTYLDGVTEILSDHGIVILDIRKETEKIMKDTNGLEACREAFETISVVKEDHKYRRILCDTPVRPEPTETPDEMESIDEEIERSQAGVV